MVSKRTPAQPARPVAPIDWPRADPAALAAFDPATRRCTMNCGPVVGDPRCRAERLLLCDDCEQVQPQAVGGPSADRRALVECLRGVAADYRQREPMRPAGVVLIWQGVAYGWKDRLRDPASERPGAYAVDEAGAIHCATGGNDYDGAQAWRPLECEQ